MEYTSNERQILSLMERTDFRNLSKNELSQVMMKAQIRCMALLTKK